MVADTNSNVKRVNIPSGGHSNVKPPLVDGRTDENEAMRGKRTRWIGMFTSEAVVLSNAISYLGLNG